MSDVFKLNQGNDGVAQYATVNVPGCGSIEQKDGHPLQIDIIGDKITLYIFGDINSVEPTHEIDLSGALEKYRKVKHDTE